MRLADIKPPAGTNKSRKRVCRGGKLGKTGTRGSNGQNSRSGKGKAPGFEGGQTPWYMRLPKFRGFNNVFKESYVVVNLGTLEEKFSKGEEVTPDKLVEFGVIKNLNSPVKILGSGAISKSLTVKAHKFSENAKAAIEKAGGKAEVI